MKYFKPLFLFILIILALQLRKTPKFSISENLNIVEKLNIVDLTCQTLISQTPQNTYDGFLSLLMVPEAVSQSEGCSLARTLASLSLDEARVRPSVCNVKSLERLARVEWLPLLLFNIAPVLNILIVEIVIGDSS